MTDHQQNWALPSAGGDCSAANPAQYRSKFAQQFSKDAGSLPASLMAISSTGTGTDQANPVCKTSPSAVKQAARPRSYFEGANRRSVEVTQFQQNQAPLAGSSLHHNATFPAQHAGADWLQSSKLAATMVEAS